MNLTDENYFSKENNIKYMSASQFKDFLKCPACAMAKLKEEWKQEKTTALMVGSQVDASYEGTLDIFKAKNPEIFNNILKKHYYYTINDNNVYLDIPVFELMHLYDKSFLGTIRYKLYKLLFKITKWQEKKVKNKQNQMN